MMGIAKSTVLLVDDDHRLRALVTEYLQANGLAVAGAGTASEAENLLSMTTFELVLLDLNLPDGDGIELTRKWRSEKKIAIICMTGRIDEADRVMGLELGADDYITKPFSLRELLARIRAVTRRTQGREPLLSPAPTLVAPISMPVTRGKHPRAYRFSLWVLNVNSRRLTSPAGKLVALTNAEFILLMVFLGAPRHIISRDLLLERTHAFDDIYERAIDVQIVRLRKKIEVDAGQPTLLRTERGVGYFLDSAVEVIWD